MMASTHHPTSSLLSKPIYSWQPASWDDYVRYRDAQDSDSLKLFFHQGLLLVDNMGWEGIDHAAIRDLFSFIFAFWFNLYPDPVATSLGGCLLEREQDEAGSPDLVLYLGEGYPQWQMGEPRKVDLKRWRAPDLVGEIADTSLATDLDQKKALYAALGIPEYWVVDVRGQRVFIFELLQSGNYQEKNQSTLLYGLTVELLEQTIQRCRESSNLGAATWFNQQINQPS